MAVFEITWPGRGDKLDRDRTWNALAAINIARSHVEGGAPWAEVHELITERQLVERIEKRASRRGDRPNSTAPPLAP